MTGGGGGRVEYPFFPFWTGKSKSLLAQWITKSIVRIIIVIGMEQDGDRLDGWTTFSYSPSEIRRSALGSWRCCLISDYYLLDRTHLAKATSEISHSLCLLWLYGWCKSWFPKVCMRLSRNQYLSIYPPPHKKIIKKKKNQWFPSMGLFDSHSIFLNRLPWFAASYVCQRNNSEVWPSSGLCSAVPEPRPQRRGDFLHNKSSRKKWKSGGKHVHAGVERRDGFCSCQLVCLSFVGIPST